MVYAADLESAFWEFESLPLYNGESESEGKSECESEGESDLGNALAHSHPHSHSHPQLVQKQLWLMQRFEAPRK